MMEREIKLRVYDIDRARSRLEELGWRSVRGPYFERNVIYDTRGKDLDRAGKMLRVRHARSMTLLTVKLAPLPDSAHKAREEHEAELPQDAVLEPLLEALGFEPVWRYEKRRTRYEKLGENGVVELDETPVGDILELEGEAEWIDRTAAQLGYAAVDYFKGSYRDLFRDECGENAGDMVFPPDPVEEGGC